MEGTENNGRDPSNKLDKGNHYNHGHPDGPRDPLGKIADTLGDGLVVRNPGKVVRTDDQPLWTAIEECVSGRRFEEYNHFIKGVLYADEEKYKDYKEEITLPNYSPFHYKYGVHGYEMLKAATEVFLLSYSYCGDILDSFTKHVDQTKLDKLGKRLGYKPDLETFKAKLASYLKSETRENILPYIEKVAEKFMANFDRGDEYPFSNIQIRDSCLFELIWSYWHEEGMLTQTLSAIALRFQNRQVGPPGRDPLANFELDPLRPISNLLWGYISDIDRKLTVKRRAYEYDHEYGLKLVGKAVGVLKPADRRSKFIHAFHNLLHQCSLFYKDDSNHWITPDTFPMLQAIKEVHLILAEGAHNQWGDLPSTARIEMMIEQWLLAQPPIKEFLRSRPMVPYQEEWMGTVDVMKNVMNWTDVSIIHFHQLAVFGEMILLSLRFGNWSDINLTSDNATSWAKYWKPRIQGYIESYRAATGVDLSATVEVSRKIDAIMPSTHLKRRLDQQQKGMK